MSAAHPHQQDPAAAVADALRHLSPDCDRETWVTLGMAVKAALGEAGFDLWDGWSQGADSYRAKDARDAWKSFKADGRVTAGTLFHRAREAGWRAPGGVHLPPPPPDPKAREAEAQAERERHQVAAAKAWNIWRYAPIAREHPYLTRKRIAGHGARLAFGKLVLPLYDAALNLANLQFISGDGEKRFLSGGRKAGCFWWAGPDGTETVCLAEGYATAASVHQATGHRCYIAFDAGNLPAVAEIVAARHPGTDIVICADHDATGLKYAGIAAARVSARVAVPEKPRPELDKWDFNDVYAAMAGGCHGRT